jgi:hypothetical protein
MKKSNLFYLLHFVLQRILMWKGGHKKRKLKKRVFSFYTPSRLLLKKMHALRKLVYEITTRPDVLFLFAPQPPADLRPLPGAAHNTASQVEGSLGLSQKPTRTMSSAVMISLSRSSSVATASSATLPCVTRLKRPRNTRRWLEGIHT